MYVIKIDAKKNLITVGPKSELGVQKITLRNLNYLNKDVEKFNSNLKVKVRSTGNMIKAEIKVKKDIAEIILEKKELGISPGQACVFYTKNEFGDKVLGGGWIVNN